MAARLAGTGANGLVLYNADMWRDRVHLMNRDCNQQQIGDPIDAVNQGNVTYLPAGTQSKDQFSAAHTVETISENAPALTGSSVVAMKWNSFSGGCVQASMARTLMGKEIYQAVSKKNVYRSILLPEQPFAYAGDVTLTAVKLNNGKYAVSVTGLQYINDENIAVTVLYAAFSEYDPFTGLLNKDAKNATYKVYFLSTETMGLSETPWAREAQDSAAATEGMLCPAMRRLPNLGSLGMELAVAGVEIIRKIVDIGISLAGLIEIWGKQQSCPLVTHGHSLLQRCGSDLLSLDEFFEAIFRANAHFWRSFSLVAERIRDMDEQNLANVVDGVAYYGESTLSPLDAYKSTVSTMRLPTEEMGDQFIQVMIYRIGLLQAMHAYNPL